MVMPPAAHPLAADLDHVMAETGSIWDDLRGARLFITGGSGFFGCWLLESLLWANDSRSLGASAVVLTRDGKAFHTRSPHLASHPSVTVHDGAMGSFDFPEGRFTHVIHAAVQTTAAPGRRERLEEFDSTVGGTRRVLEFARRSGAKRFLFTSSGSVYGPQPADLARIPEAYNGAPDVSAPPSAGAEAKRAAEMLCALYADATLEPMSARCFTFVGPYLPLDGKFAVGNFIRDGLRGDTVRVSGDGTPIRSYLYAADLTIWLWTILVRGLAGRAYNVGSERPVSIGDVALAVSRRFNPSAAVAIAGAPTPGQRPSRYLPDTERARVELGLRETIDLDEALGRTLRWHTRQLAPVHVER